MLAPSFMRRMDAVIRTAGIVVLALLLGCGVWLLRRAAPAFVDEGALRVATAAAVRGLQVSIQNYFEDVGAYPNSWTDLLVEPSRTVNWRGPYIRSSDPPRDAWGRPLVYHLDTNAHSFHVCSFGRDGLPGGDGLDSDIVRSRGD